ncbi:MAG: protein tyrosine phosphatase [Bauldia sp.]|uniref:tyrosine phosphatase family protein n=1 Tax=Bauldia sp. TaxID=2575872 RepID=UPI001D1DD48E|nr:protein tyrosine phosphatase [Bauldia sp.]MCB1498106.1 protein tyrosine phosphatase [Bauldia sp.]
MPQVHVCPLSQVPATVAASGASHLVSVINDDTPVVRPSTIARENHLFLGINDIVEPTEGLVAATEDHVRELITFVERWDGERAMVVHCYAGISRSTAAAFVALCTARPDRSEREVALRLREASPWAYPNPLIVAFGDELLGRNGRMVEAINAIGRGELAFENSPFSVPLQD